MKDKTSPVSVSGNAKIAIAPTETISDLNGTLWGIDWFDMKWPPLHRIYMALIMGRVKKYRGTLYFKGTMVEMLEGDACLDRDSLIIVQYPDANSFLKAFSSTFFFIKNLLKTYAVCKFSFGFTRRLRFEDHHETLGTYKKTHYYLVHVFRTNSRQVHLLKQDIQHFQSNEVKLFFAGVKTAQVGRSKNGSLVTKSPFSMDGILLWQSDSVGSLYRLSRERWYEAFKVQHKANGLYLFRRER